MENNAGKKKPEEYVLCSRSQRERERIIADAAASVLSRVDVADPLRPLDSSFANCEPLSDYLKQWWHRNVANSSKTSLWQLAGFHLFIFMQFPPPPPIISIHLFRIHLNGFTPDG